MAFKDNKTVGEEVSNILRLAKVKFNESALKECGMDWQAPLDQQQEDRYNLTITTKDKTVTVNTTNPEDIIHLMKLGGMDVDSHTVAPAPVADIGFGSGELTGLGLPGMSGEPAAEGIPVQIDVLSDMGDEEGEEEHGDMDMGGDEKGDEGEEDEGDEEKEAFNFGEAKEKKDDKKADKKAEKKSSAEQMREYVEKVTATMGDDGANTKSIVASKNDMGGTAKNLNQAGTEKSPVEANKGQLKGSSLFKGTEKEDNAGNVNVPGGKAAKSLKAMSKGHGAEKKGAGEQADNKKSTIGSK